MCIRDSSREGLIWANFGDFDTLYGHRNDVQGFARAVSYTHLDVYKRQVLDPGAGLALFLERRRYPVRCRGRQNRLPAGRTHAGPDRGRAAG